MFTRADIDLHQRGFQSTTRAQRGQVRKALVPFGLSIRAAPPLTALERRVGINRNKLALGFKNLFGVTIGEFGRSLSLERARTLLQRRQLPNRHVANLAGYADPGSFSKAFRLEYGVLPSELRDPDVEKVTAAQFFGTPARHGAAR